MVMVVLIVLLVCSLAGVCWKPFSNNPRSRSSGTNSRSNSRGSSTSTSRPLVYADAPPSYEDILSVEVLEEPSGDSQEDQVADKHTSNTVQRHILKPDLDEAESGTSNQHISPPRRYSPFISETLYSYASASEIQLSVEQLQIDRLPTYEEAVAALQLEPTTQYEASTNYDMDSMFI
nr:uncharacterized protein LOC128700556 [Cherax quadricarinatus]